MQVDSHNTQRALLKIKRHSSSVPMDVDKGASKIGLKQNSSVDQMRIDECSGHHVERIKQDTLSDKSKTNRSNEDTKNFTGGPSSWYGF